MLQKQVLTDVLFVDKYSHIPIYIQLKEILQNIIQKKKILPGKKIPSENELSQKFNISRMTVRHAIKELEKDGYVYIKKGEGTFVNDKQNVQMLVKLFGFSKEMKRLGHKVSSRVLHIEKIKYNSNCANIFNGLNVSNDNEIVLIKRLRYLNNKPFAIETSYLKHSVGKKLLQMDFKSDFSIYEYIEKDLLTKLSKAEHIIQPVLSDKDISNNLKIKISSPILYICGVTFSTENQPIEYLEGFYRGDKYKLNISYTK